MCGMLNIYSLTYPTNYSMLNQSKYEIAIRLNTHTFRKKHIDTSRF